MAYNLILNANIAQKYLVESDWKNPINAHIVEKHSVFHNLWRNMNKFTLVENHINDMFVQKLSIIREIWRLMNEFTQMKNPINVNVVWCNLDKEIWAYSMQKNRPI